MKPKLALITGGSRGIGRAIKQALEDRGWQVAAPSRVELDFASGASVAYWLMHNGGFTAQAYDAVIFSHGEWYSRANFRPADYVAQYRMRVVYPLSVVQSLLFAERVKHVIMISSTRAFMGGVKTGPYSAACAAQIAAMQGYAREYPRVLFSSICPGLTDTDMGIQVIATGGAKPDAIPQSPESVAEAVLLVLAAGINGRIVRVVDGKINEMTWSMIENG